MALIDTLPIPKQQVETLLALHNQVNVRGEEVTTLTPAQFNALQAAYDALKAAGRANSVSVKAHAMRIGLKL